MCGRGCIGISPASRRASMCNKDDEER